MNKKDRKQLAKIIEVLDGVLSDLRELGEAEREKYDNLPEGLQNCESGERMDEIANMLEEQADNLESIIGELGEEADPG